MSETREFVGLALRFPVVAVLTFLWILTIWPLIVAVTVWALFAAPALYPFSYSWEWLKFAFLGRKDPILPGYWKGYPDDYIKNFKIGFPTLKKWLLEGWN